MNLISMSDKAIAAQIGSRIEQIRLENNVTQQFIADQVGLTRKTYRQLVGGKAKLESIIGVLRVLNRLDLVDNFIPSTGFSPMELLKLQGKKRQRARHSQVKNQLDNVDSVKDKKDESTLDW